MTTHEGADMSTHPEVVTLDPNDAEQMDKFITALIDAGASIGFADVAGAVRAMATPPLPEEPPLYTVVHVPSLNQWQRWTRLDQPAGRNWVDNRADWSSWEQVCALGTPEVLEPESVKALREQVGRYDAWLARVGDALAEARGVRVHWSDLDTSVKALVDRAEKAEREVEEFIAIDEGATEDEPAEPAPVEVTPGQRYKDKNNTTWKVLPSGMLQWEGGWSHWTFSDVEAKHGPLTLVETGGQS